MRSARFGLAMFLLFLGIPVRSQQAPPSQTPPAQTQQSKSVAELFQPTRDPQAVTVANQVLTAAGGIDAIKAIKDYTASGTMTPADAKQDTPIQLTITARGLSNFRMDTNVTKGTSSWAMAKGKVSTQNADGGVSQSYMRAPLSPSTLLFPHLLLAYAVSIPYLSLSYQGLVQFNGQSVHDLRVQPTMSQGSDPKGLIAPLSAVDILVDTSTFQIVATRDMARTIRNMWIGHLHEIQYSDYRTVNGVSIPYSISESIGAQTPRSLHVASITVNSGLTDTQFQLQQATR